MKKKIQNFMKIWDYIFMYIIILISLISVVKNWDDNDSIKGLIASLTIVICCGFVAIYRKIDATFKDENKIKLHDKNNPIS